MKYYHVIIEKKHGYFEGEKAAEKMKETRQEIICENKVRCPEGWRIVGVCGYHEEPTKRHKGDKKQ
jgi:hypothetical protein